MIHIDYLAQKHSGGYFHLLFSFSTRVRNFLPQDFFPEGLALIHSCIASLYMYGDTMLTFMIPVHLLSQIHEF